MVIEYQILIELINELANLDPQMFIHIYELHDKFVAADYSIEGYEDQLLFKGVIKDYLERNINQSNSFSKSF